MKELLLITFDGNCADEFDVVGFDIVEKSWWERFTEKLPDKPITEYCGSNQNLEWRNKKEYLADFKVKEITEEEAETIKKFFPFGSFGRVPFYEDFDFDEEEE